MISPPTHRPAKFHGGWLIAVIAVALVGEAWLAARKLMPVPTSDAAVYHMLGAAEEPLERSMAGAVRVYGADHGVRRVWVRQDGLRIDVFYFTWERAEMGPVVELVNHTPEQCNVASGYIFLGLRPARVHEFPNGEQLAFDVTAFKGRDGTPMLVFKGAWLQGMGNMNLDRVGGRVVRLKRAVIRHAGEARVLQGSVTGTVDEETAWRIFADEVLSQLVWTEGASPET
jgi:hypothetical protein